MIERKLTSYISRVSTQFSVIGIMGPRQSGKTTLAKLLFPDYEYVNFEHQDILDEARHDLAQFMERHRPPVIFDEVQRYPAVLNEIQCWVDNHNHPPASYVITGSNQPHLRGVVSESLAGRIAIAYLLPLSFAEIGGDGVLDREQSIIRGFMPRVLSNDIDVKSFYQNYLTTYVERDANQLINLRDSIRFSSFIRLLAARVGQLLNYDSIATEIGVTAATIRDWISVLEASFIVFHLLPYYRNFGKRFVKTPKIYFMDVGLAAYLLDIDSPEQMSRDPLFGHLFENMIVANIRKNRFNTGYTQGGTAGMYFIRDRHGDEVDLVLEGPGRKLELIEIKSAMSYNPDYAKSIEKYAKILGDDFGGGKVIYAGSRAGYHGIDFVNFAET